MNEIIDAIKKRRSTKRFKSDAVPKEIIDCVIDAGLCAANAQGKQVPVVVAVNDSTDTLVPADSGVAVDADASVDRLTGPTINPVTLIKRLSGTDVDAVTTVDSAELTAALNARLDTLATGTADAVVTIEGTTPVVTPGSDGTGLDVEASVKALSSGWPLGKESISLVGGTAKPAITDEDARAFVDAVLTPMLSDDITITASGTDVERVATGKQLVLTPNRLADVISVSTADGALSVDFDSQRLHDDVISALIKPMRGSGPRPPTTPRRHWESPSLRLAQRIGEVEIGVWVTTPPEAHPSPAVSIMIHDNCSSIGRGKQDDRRFVPWSGIPVSRHGP